MPGFALSPPPLPTHHEFEAGSTQRNKVPHHIQEGEMLGFPHLAGKKENHASARTHTTTSYSVPVCCQGGRSKNGTNQNGSGESNRRREDGGLHLLGSSESSSTQKCHRYSSPRPRLHHRRRHSAQSFGPGRCQTAQCFFTLKLASSPFEP